MKATQQRASSAVKSCTGRTKPRLGVLSLSTDLKMPDWANCSILIAGGPKPQHRFARKTSSLEGELLKEWVFCERAHLSAVVTSLGAHIFFSD
jgi:hypothetical protein